MGSFKGAARMLNTSQSAVSRLIQEFESGFAAPLFAREQRSVLLTMEGQEALRVARAALRQRATLTERFCDPHLISPVLRFGATELATITWLPDFVGQLRARYPRVQVEVKVASSPELKSMLDAGQLDVAVVIDTVRSSQMVRVPIGSSEVRWYCAPSFGCPSHADLNTLERQTLLLQGATTGGGGMLLTWFKEHAIQPGNVIQCDSLMALLGMARAGLGLALLPVAVAAEPVRAGWLHQVTVSLETPPLKFVALVKIDTVSDFHRTVVDIVKACADFGSHPAAADAAEGA
jgi:DNA-binding transcriptional LysR family regulator